MTPVINTQHVLSTGIVVEETTRKSNRTGYTGAALSPSWTLDADKPFIAACANPTDPAVMAQMSAQERTAWHGGSYADAREAAYVVGMFHADPVGTERLIKSSGPVDQFPKDLYDLPVGLTNEAAVEILNTKKALKKKTTVTVKLDAGVPAAGNLGRVYTIESIRAAAKKCGGPEQFQTALKGVNVVEAAVKFNLIAKV
jgi:hypothetical protein